MPRSKTAVTLANINVLIKQLTRQYGSKQLWITEYGYQTRPPDRHFGVTWAKQAKYLAQAFKIARKNPRISMMTWFLLRDEKRLAGWQSGLDDVRREEEARVLRVPPPATLERMAIRTPQRGQGSHPRPPLRPRPGPSRIPVDIRSGRPFFLTAASSPPRGRRIASIAALVVLDLGGLVLGLYAALVAARALLRRGPVLWGFALAGRDRLAAVPDARHRARLLAGASSTPSASGGRASGGSSRRSSWSR